MQRQKLNGYYVSDIEDFYRALNIYTGTAKNNATNLTDHEIKVLKNIYSKLAKNGILFIFEHNPINPLTQFIYYKNDHQFDKNSQLLSPLYTRSLLNYAGFSNFKVKYTIFFPQFLSFLIKYEKYLESVPLGAHYYYIAKKD